MNCWMFPGQPLRHDQLFPATPEGEEIISLCCAATGFDPSNWQNDGQNGSEHVRLQLYGTAFSLCRTRLLRSAGPGPDMVLEHSMGIYAALAACGCISERSALELTARVGSALIRMSESARYALGCVIGLGRVPVEKAAANHGVYVANYNTSSHFLLAGERSRIMSAMEECAAAGAFSMSVFDCDAPLHTPLLTEVAADLEAIFSDYSYAEPQMPLLDHIDQQPLTSTRIAVFLLDELLKPVWWQRSYAAARSLGAAAFVEVGAGDALKKFNRWIDSESRA
ncbi:MAG: acyltransferase domain-containing protein [Steroidobacteraceae bacterium]|nr:acyltransferase domain-containing protein [Deltaproteobacteria bacterium]